MKKVFLLLITVLAFNLSNAQEGFSITTLQNLDNEKLNVLVETKVTTENIVVGFGGEFLAASNVKRFNASLGYNLKLAAFNITPSLIVGASVDANDYNKFYGSDIDAGIKLSNSIAIVGKLRYASSADGKFNLDNFNPRYFTGIRLTF